MCETFKWIKLLVVESQKDDLQIPVKISLGKWLWTTRELFKVRQKYKYLTLRSSNFNLRVRRIFSMRHMTWPMLSWNRHRADNSKCSNLICCKRQVQNRFDVFLSPFVAHKAELCFCLHNVRCTSPTVNLFNGRIPWICDPLSTHMIITASKSKTAKSFVDSCLLCTTPKYYVWSSWFDGLNPCLQRFLVRHAMLSSHFMG